MTCLEDVPDGQSVRGGLTANNVRNKVADYFLTDAGAASWQMSKIWTAEYINIKKNISLYEFHSAVFNKLWHYSTKAFFEHLLELRSLLEDKYKLLSMPFSFRFCLYKHHPSCPTTSAWLPPEILTNQCRTQNRPSSPLEDYCFSTLLILQWKVNARIQPGQNRSVWTCL